MVQPSRRATISCRPVVITYHWRRRGGLLHHELATGENIYTMHGYYKNSCQLTTSLSSGLLGVYTGAAHACSTRFAARHASPLSWWKLAFAVPYLVDLRGVLMGLVEAIPCPRCALARHGRCRPRGLHKVTNASGASIPGTYPSQAARAGKHLVAKNRDGPTLDPRRASTHEQLDLESRV